MKNIDETVSTVFNRMALYRAKQQKRKQVLLSTALPLGCICLIGILCLGLMRQPSTPNNIQAFSPNVSETKQDTLPDVQAPVTEPTAPPVTESSVKPSENKILINPIESIQSDMDIALMLDDFVSMTRQQLNEYYGINVSPAIPSDMMQREQDFGIYKRNQGTGEIYHDVNVIRYDNDDYSRTVNIQISKGKIPFSCCMFLYDDDDKSMINGTEVAIGLCCELGDYYVEFMYQDVGFRIHTIGVTETELIEIISSIIKQ